MKAMILTRLSPVTESEPPLQFVDLPIPEPGEGQVLVEVSACGVCHTELDEIEGRTPPPILPLVPGHQVIGRVFAIGKGASRWKVGDRVGVAWIYTACGVCDQCLAGNENLCLQYKATGRDVPGGYAQYMVANQDFLFAIPPVFSDAEAAPLLCAGAVGYRSLRLANLRNGERLGLVGFGASAHLVLQMARAQYPDSPIYVITRSTSEQQFSLELGASWAGGFDKATPIPLSAMIDTTPVWRPVLFALENLAPGGRLVINAIRKEETDKDHLIRLDYSHHLWLEKEIKSVANVTRADVVDFLSLASKMNIQTEYQEYSLEAANNALIEMKTSKIRGAKVLKIQSS